MDNETGDNPEVDRSFAKRPDAVAAAPASHSKTVALVGFSCSGKSTLGKRILNAFKQSALGPLIYCDSDDEIGEPFGGIAELYMNLGYDAALKYVGEKERAFLNALQPSGAPRLVVPGPNVVLRDPEWQGFLRRVQPIIYYLTISLGECYRRLRRRDTAAMKKYAGKANAGCWNRGVFRNENGAEFSEAEAKSHLESNMQIQLGLYKAANPKLTFDAKELEKGARLGEAMNQVRGDLL